NLPTRLTSNLTTKKRIDKGDGRGPNRQDRDEGGREHEFPAHSAERHDAGEQRDRLTPDSEEPADLTDRPGFRRETRRRVLILGGRQESDAQRDRPSDRHEGGEDEQDARHEVHLPRR